MRNAAKAGNRLSGPQAESRKPDSVTVGKMPFSASLDTDGGKDGGIKKLYAAGAEVVVGDGRFQVGKSCLMAWRGHYRSRHEVADRHADSNRCHPDCDPHSSSDDRARCIDIG